MIVIVFVLFVGVLAVVAFALVATRSVTLDVEKRKARLHEPGAETLVYDVPAGQDPVVLTVALAHAGFRSVEETVKGMSQLLVDCPRGRGEDRSRVRAVIEQVYASEPTGAGVRLDPVLFTDEC